MLDTPPVSRRTRALVCAIAVLLFFWVALYRFNTLGGRFGGFENDHFVAFAYAKQVEAGEQPLRDFEGLGLQGAWPSLTYELSALAQRGLGDNLRSEAVLTVAGVALAAALTFLAASQVSAIGWGLAATLVGVLVAPTLYNYIKVLTLAAAALAIVVYARKPRMSIVAASAVITAIAFLFRHDLAAYVGVGVVCVCMSASSWRRGIQHTAAYIVLTLLLLTPSLVYVHYYDGLITYFRDGVALSQREAERTPLLALPRFVFETEPGAPVGIADFFDVEQNGVAWLYCLVYLLPLLAVIVMWRQAPREPDWRITAVIAIAVMTLFSSQFLIRSNVGARLGDVGPLVSVLLAVVCHAGARRWRTDTIWWRATRMVVVLLLFTATTMSAATVGAVRSQLRTSRMDESWAAVLQHLLNVSNELKSMPSAALDDANQGSPLYLARYINQCTAPSDRIVLMTYRPELLPFAGRLFGAGRLSVVPGYVLGEPYQRKLIAWWRQQSVPIALVGFDAFSDPRNPLAALVRDYLLTHYEMKGIVGAGDSALRVFVRRDLTATSSFGEEKLPCARS